MEATTHSGNLKDAKEGFRSEGLLLLLSASSITEFAAAISHHGACRHNVQRLAKSHTGLQAVMNGTAILSLRFSDSDLENTHNNT